MTPPTDPRKSATDATSQTARAIAMLRQMLLRGDFRPGERVAELTLVPRLQASRTPVRLALDRLAHEGLLEALPAGGFRIREFAIADIWDAIEIRGVLDGTAARLAAERLTNVADLAQLQQCCRDMERLQPLDPDRFQQFVDLDEAFHAELRRLARSSMLERTIDGMLGLTFASSGGFLSGDEQSSDGAHARLISYCIRPASP